MRIIKTMMLGMIVAPLILTGCQQEKTERSVTFEGPEKEYEVEMETTDKDTSDDE